MAKYVFVYHGGTLPRSTHELEAVKAQWSAWFDSMGTDVLDPGDPVGLNPSNLDLTDLNQVGGDPLSGFSLIEARSLNDAIEKAQSCPILKTDGRVELTQAQLM